ncbi:hypothetical protein EZ449_05405 [Pedobacter frigidisoli]|uniref:Tetratricopeptide repeat protein n=1 Tax=Pedobacter frigidisoli TaxID=2530455 RepID=A0A4R0P497_9SPHI|nr:hypothetical protein [Pedobacter frigidisoli]TCD11694.1 hypothetical protein EZ449_05405 [Pedobacter frigidisoli]
MDNNKLLANLLAQPGKVGPEHVPMLKEMAALYPYAQPIHLLLAKAEASFIPKAALYSQGNVLFHVLNMVSIKEDVEEITALEDERAFAEIDAESSQDEQEIFDEIGEPNEVSVPNITQPINIETPNNLPGIDSHLMDLPVEEDSFIESIAASDFFAFEQKLSTDVVVEAPHIETVVPDEPELHRVSKYDDDQLPYTFLWWLAKTRKEHEQIFQPYAQPKPGLAKKQTQPTQQQNRAEFQQQFVEHIFHIQTPFEVADHLAEYPNGEVKDAKGAEIIDKFLKEDPTIKPPKPEQIDNENKAKKSAEDRYDLVSETLAKIYIEQMLYHKAIDTYKKLSLKYPEKSGYFADLIQSIEKKF